MEGIAPVIGRCREARLSFYRWRNGAAVASKVMLSLAMSCFTGLMAQIVVYLPWTPVPVTGQTLAVLIAAMVLGRWGALSQAIYIAIGLAGVPWFAGAGGGPAVLGGPTFGYLLGFVAAAYAVGTVLERHEGMRRLVPLLVIMAAANFIIILGLGAFYLYAWLGAVRGEAPGLYELLSMGVIPFVPGAAAKTVLAAFIGTAIMPKERIPF